MRGENADHERHNRTRSIELARLLVGKVGEFLDEVFISLPEDIRLAVLVAEIKAGEVLDEVLEQPI